MVCIRLSQIEKIKMIVSIKINNLVQVRKKVTAKNVLVRVRRFDCSRVRWCEGSKVWIKTKDKR
jgi:hypothetical protein